MIRRPPRSTRTDTPFPYTTLFRSTVPSKRRLRWALLPVGIATAAVLSGCSPSQLHGFLPGFQEDGVPTTDRVDMVSGLWVNRSEEHTSELQSLMRNSYAVFCLTKNKKINN